MAGMVDLLASRVVFFIYGLYFPSCCVLFFLFLVLCSLGQWLHPPCWHNGEVTAVTLLQNKDLACAKTANSWGHTCTRPGFGGVSYSFAPTEDSTHRHQGPCCLCQDMLTSLLYHGDCWGKQAVTVSWFTFNSKFSLFYLFVLITSSHHPHPHPIHHQ